MNIQSSENFEISIMSEFSTSNPSKIYYSCKNNEATLQNKSDYQNLFKNKFQDYVLFIFAFFSSRFKKLTIASNKDVVTISNIEKHINQFHNIDDDISKDLAQMTAELKNCINIFKKMCVSSDKINFGNINPIKNTIEKIIDNYKTFTKKEKEKQNIDNAKQDVIANFEAIRTIFYQFNNILKTLKIINYKIFTFLCKSIKLMNEIETKKESAQYFPTQFLIDNDENPIIELFNNNKEKEDIQSQMKQLVQFYQMLINDITDYPQKKDHSNEAACSDLSNDIKYDFRDFIRKEVTAFTTELSNIFDMKSDYSKLTEKLKEISNNIFPNMSEAEFDFDNLTTDFYFIELRSIIKNHYKMSGENIIKIIESISNFYIKEVGKEPITQIYDDIINRLPIREVFPRQILDKKGFNQRFFQLLFNSNYLKNKIKELFQNSSDNSNEVLHILVTHNFPNYDLYFDNDNKFILKRKYFSDDFIQKDFKREMEIFQSNYSKYIVHYNAQNQNYIPYFPIGPLKCITIKLSDSDKLVMLLEIATALKDLHSNNRYHGNLSNDSIFINPDRDAYIGSIYFNQEAEKVSTFKSDHIFYRSPEKLNENQQNEERSEDIYSFGVLMHEIITDTTPKNRMKNIKQDQRNEILKNNYKDFLFKGEHNEKFEKTKDHNMSDMKGIIEKCLEKDPTKRLNMEKIIDLIKETTSYKEHKEEIEYRISKSKDSRTYQCTFSDIIKSYYEGQEDCLNVIEKFTTKYLNICAKKGLNIEQYIKTILNVIENPVDGSIEEDDKYINDIEQIIEYSPDIIKSDLRRMYQEFFNIIDLKLSKLSKKEKTILLLDDIQRRNKFYFFDDIYQIIIKNFIHQKYFEDKLEEVLQNYSGNIDEMQEVRELLQFNGINASYKLLVGRKFHFYLQKSYTSGINQNQYEHEKSIFLNEYSKFIVHSDITKQRKDKYRVDTKIILPYFPMGTIDSISIDSISKRQIELSNSDKLVMILEIATALRDLHSNKEYHGNLSNQSIFINSDRDAYIGAICHDEALEKHMTKQRGPFYYRPPDRIYDENKIEEMIKIQREKEGRKDDEFIQYQQKGDIYSFGVLMHEIITDISPNDRMGNMPREDRIKLMKNNYKDFLINEKLDEKKDHNMSDMEEIIKKCLEKDPTKRLNMEKIIDLIKETTSYKEHKEEIEYRISKSKDSRTYQCTFSDIVESYYEGQEYCLKDIKEFLKQYDKLSSTNNISILVIQNDIIKKIYETFDINYDNDSSFYFDDVFEDIFTKIVQESVKRKICENNITDFNDNLFNFSLESNLKQIQNYTKIELKSNIDFIIPVSTLGNFIEHNKDKIGDLIPTWIYFISKELSIIHSINLYHGKLSMDNIGIYYNHETQTFIPSIILFYSIHKQNHGQHKLYSSHDQSYSEETINEKYQKKDIKNLCKIINQFELIPNNIKKEIEQASTVNKIVYVLYNFINKNSNIDQKEIFDKNKNFSHDDYSSYQITYRIMINMYKSMENKFSFEKSFIEIGSIFGNINKFLDIAKDNLNQSIYYNINQAFITKSEQCNITKILSDIKGKCSELCMYNNKLQPISENESYTISNRTGQNDTIVRGMLINLTENKVDMIKEKQEALDQKEVYRYIEFSGLSKKSFRFLLTRYILNLNPEIVFKIKVKITNHKYLETTDSSIKIEDIRKIVNIINPNWMEPEAQEALIIVYVNKPKNIGGDELN